MAKPLDIQWFLQKASDQESQRWLLQVNDWREEILRTNTFIDDDRHFDLKLEDYTLRFNAGSAFSALEVYQEIFRDGNHFLAPGFSNKTNKIVFDIGANQGFYLLKLKKINPSCHVIAVEPNPLEFETLRENIRLNKIHNVSLEHKALAATSGTTIIEFIPQIGAITGSNVKIPERPWLNRHPIKKKKVQSITLDDLFVKYRIDRVNLVKIDVEGAEYDILRSSTSLDRIDKLVIEYHSSTLRSQLLNLLDAKYFELIHEERSEADYYGELYFINTHSEVEASL